jgi:hypothetical protein
MGYGCDRSAARAAKICSGNMAEHLFKEECVMSLTESYVNSIGMEFVLIPASESMMESDTDAISVAQVSDQWHYLKRKIDVQPTFSLENMPVRPPDVIARSEATWQSKRPVSLFRRSRKLNRCLDCHVAQPEQ